MPRLSVEEDGSVAEHGGPRDPLENGTAFLFLALLAGGYAIGHVRAWYRRDTRS